MKRTTAFETDVAAALANPSLQAALADVPAGFVAGRARVKATLPEFQALRRTGRDIRDHSLAHLDLYLEAFETNATRAGTRVHWAMTGADACDIILAICREVGARVVTKSKSMVSEEVGLRARLQEAALDVVETDLGEYIIQIRGETPSHIIAPAIHLRASEVADEFRRRHGHLEQGRDLSSPEALVGEARGVLREKFLAAEVGITGANFLIASTGSAIVVTNEGNADLTMSLPKVHIVLASIDKVVPTLNDAWPLLRLLARSATGQEFTAYTTLVTGPRRRRGCRRPRGLPRRHPRQRPLGAFAQQAARGSALHPLRRLHEPLPGVLFHRRPCLRLGLSGADRRRVDAGAGRNGGDGTLSAGFDLLRPLRGGLPGRDPARFADAPLARGGDRRARVAAQPRSVARLGISRHAAARLPIGGPESPLPQSQGWHAAAGNYVRYHSAGAGRATGTFQRRRGAPF